MSHLIDPYAFTITGDPIYGHPVPELRGEGGPLNEVQIGAARAVYDRFVSEFRASLLPFQAQAGTLPDGSPYRIVAMRGHRIMQVWPVGGNADDNALGGGFLFYTIESFVVRRGFIMDVDSVGFEHKRSWSLVEKTAAEYAALAWAVGGEAFSVVRGPGKARYLASGYTAYNETYGVKLLDLTDAPLKLVAAVRDKEVITVGARIISDFEVYAVAQTLTLAEVPTLTQAATPTIVSTSPETEICRMLGELVKTSYQGRVLVRGYEEAPDPPVVNHSGSVLFLVPSRGAGYGNSLMDQTASFMLVPNVNHPFLKENFYCVYERSGDSWRRQQTIELADVVSNILDGMNRPSASEPAYESWPDVSGTTDQMRIRIPKGSAISIDNRPPGVGGLGPLPSNYQDGERIANSENRTRMESFAVEPQFDYSGRLFYVKAVDEVVYNIDYYGKYTSVLKDNHGILVVDYFIYDTTATERSSATTVATFSNGRTMELSTRSLTLEWTKYEESLDAVYTLGDTITCTVKHNATNRRIDLYDPFLHLLIYAEVVVSEDFTLSYYYRDFDNERLIRKSAAPSAGEIHVETRLVIEHRGSVVWTSPPVVNLPVQVEASRTKFLNLVPDHPELAIHDEGGVWVGSGVHPGMNIAPYRLPILRAITDDFGYASSAREYPYVDAAHSVLKYPDLKVEAGADTKRSPASGARFVRAIGAQGWDEFFVTQHEFLPVADARQRAGIPTDAVFSEEAV